MFIHLIGIILRFKAHKPFKILIKTLDIMEYIELDIQNSKIPRTNDFII